MGGRGVAFAHDYPASGDYAIHLVNWGAEPLAVHNLTIASMGCGWVGEG